VLGENVIMYPNSSIIGRAYISDNTCMSNGSFLMDTDTVDNSLIIGNYPNLIIKTQKLNKKNIYFKK